MALTGGEKPDHSTICQFRSDHREAIEGLLVQVLSLCGDAGMVKLGHVALDGTKMKAFSAFKSHPDAENFTSPARMPFSRGAA